MTRLLRADVAARRRMILGLALATAVFVVALASIEAIGGLSDIGRQAFGEAPPALSALAGSRSGFDVFTSLTGISVFLTQSAVASGLTTSQGGVLLAIASIVGVATRIGTGIFADRRPPAALRLIPWMQAVGAATMIVGATGSPLALGIGAIGAFAGGRGWSALFFIALVRSDPSRPGAIAGVGLSGLGVDNAFGPIAFGFVAQAVSFQAAWLFAAAAAGLAALAMHRGNRRLAGQRM